MIALTLSRFTFVRFMLYNVYEQSFNSYILLILYIKSIQSAEITNPIELGQTVEEKDFILDVRIFMNNYTIINLEMQVINEYNWTDRSLSYLCRAFDNLNVGDKYSHIIYERKSHL